jgi:hypothetical protein
VLAVPEPAAANLKDAAESLRTALAEEWTAPEDHLGAAEPAVVTPPPRRRALPWMLALFAAAAASVAAALLVVPGSPLSLTRDRGPDVVAVAPDTPTSALAATPTRTSAAGQAASPTPTRTTAPSTATRTPTGGPVLPSATATTPTPAAATPTATPTQTATTALSATATSTATPTPTPTPTDTPTVTPTPSPCSPVIDASAPVITLNAEGRSSITVFNRDACGAAPFVVDVVDAPWLLAAPDSGTIAAFSSVTITLASDAPPPGAAAVVSIAGPANVVSVTVNSGR